MAELAGEGAGAERVVGALLEWLVGGEGVVRRGVWVCGWRGWRWALLRLRGGRCGVGWGVAWVVAGEAGAGVVGGVGARGSDCAVVEEAGVAVVVAAGDDAAATSSAAVAASPGNASIAAATSSATVTASPGSPVSASPPRSLVRNSRSSQKRGCASVLRKSVNGGGDEEDGDGEGGGGGGGGGTLAWTRVRVRSVSLSWVGAGCGRGLVSLLRLEALLLERVKRGMVAWGYMCVWVWRKGEAW